MDKDPQQKEGRILSFSVVLISQYAWNLFQFCQMVLNRHLTERKPQCCRYTGMERIYTLVTDCPVYGCY